jgi:hypothetical protein
MVNFYIVFFAMPITRCHRDSCELPKGMCYNSDMEKSLHNVSDLPEANRSAVEAIVGHPLRSDGVLYIATLHVETEPTAVDRNARTKYCLSILPLRRDRTYGGRPKRRMGRA